MKSGAIEDLGVLDSYASTLDHIKLISAKRAEMAAKLQQAQLEAEGQLVHRIANDYATGHLTDRELCEAYDAYRAVAIQGFSSIWNASMPFSVVQMQHMKTRLRREDRCAAGSWSGCFPFVDEEATPPYQFSVVYVLFDAENIPCYVGSTENFRSRVRAHARDGKRFVRWSAHPCADREAAYQLEDRLLREHKPYLNRRVGR